MEKGWETSLRSLSPEEFHRAFWRLYDYQNSGGRTTALDAGDTSTTGIILSLIVPQIDNRLNGANGGFAAKYNRDAGGMVGGSVPPTVLKTRQDKIRQDKIKIRQDKSGADTPCPSVREEEIEAMFAELCPSLIQPRGRTEAIREAMRDAAKRYSRDEIEALFRRAESLPFLRGEEGNGKKFSLSGVLKNAEKILAGVYDPYPGGIRDAADEEYPANWADMWNTGGTPT